MDPILDKFLRDRKEKATIRRGMNYAKRLVAARKLILESEKEKNNE